MPQYRFAYNAQQELVDVLTLEPERADADGPYRCVGCDNPLVAKIRGEKKVKHFAHKSRVACSEETYLHRLAKGTFEQVYLQCLEENEPFQIELTHPKVCTKYHDIFGRRCEMGEVKKVCDLTQHYDVIRMEKRDGSFIPDLLLLDSTGRNGQIYIEVAVTHFLSEQKRASDNLIIEIPIATEDDIDKIRTRKITETEASFSNFHRLPAKVTDAECSCAFETYFCFLIFENGKCVMPHATINEIQTKCRELRDKIKYVKVLDGRGMIERQFGSAYHDMDARELFAEIVTQAYKEGFPVRNCHVCKHSSRNFVSLNSRPIFCKAKVIRCNHSEALRCDEFSPQQEKSPELEE